MFSEFLQKRKDLLVSLVLPLLLALSPTTWIKK